MTSGQVWKRQLAAAGWLSHEGKPLCSWPPMTSRHSDQACLYADTCAYFHTCTPVEASTPALWPAEAEAWLLAKLFGCPYLWGLWNTTKNILKLSKR